jgi:L-lactate dehydrogenase complex protein LldG
MSGAREAILQAIAKAHAVERPVPVWNLPLRTGDAAAAFIVKARASLAQVHEIGAAADAPAHVAAILSAGALTPALHVPADSPLNGLPWHLAPGLTLVSAAPAGEANAFAAADYGIAETGTLVFFSGAGRPSSWHFRPGREFVLLQRDRIVPYLEDVLASQRPMPSTLNLVTGPSRTADIEQTIELGAHGPREVHILIAG